MGCYPLNWLGDLISGSKAETKGRETTAIWRREDKTTSTQLPMTLALKLIDAFECEARVNLHHLKTSFFSCHGSSTSGVIVSHASDVRSSCQRTI